MQSIIDIHQTIKDALEGGNLTDAIPALEAYLSENDDPEALGLLASLYDSSQMGLESLKTYKKILENDPYNIEAMLAKIVLNTERDLNNTKEILEFMDYIIEHADLKNFSLKRVIGAFEEAIVAAFRIIKLDKGLKYFDYIYKYLSSEYKETSVYQNFCSNIYPYSTHSTYHSYDARIAMMHDIYNLYKPFRENFIKRERSCFRKINVGFLSYDLHFHPVGRFLFSLFPPIGNMEYFCYNTNLTEKDDGLTFKYREIAHKFTDIAELSDDEAEELILADNLDILFDLNGMSTGRRPGLISRRLAQIQFSWIGWPCTSALKNVDYTIVDSITAPPGSERFYTEKLAYMQKSSLCYSYIYAGDNNIPGIHEPPCLTNGFVSFGCFHRSTKYTDEILTAWAEIMRELPNARLKLMCPLSGEAVTEYGIKEKLKDNKLDMSRVDFIDKTSYPFYIRKYNEVDIMLDTFPFTGATTTCDAFMMGVPIISMYGSTYIERVGLQMLTNVGLADLAVPTIEDYIKTAVKLAKDTERLKNIRQTLRNTLRASPLADILSFKEEFENLLRRVFILDIIEKEEEGEHFPASPSKSTDELLAEVMHGLYFFENYVYDELGEKIYKRAKDELIAAQIRLIAKITDKELKQKYRKTVNLLRGDIGFRELKRITNVCVELLDLSRMILEQDNP